MHFNCTDINTFKSDLDNNVLVAQNLKKENHSSIKIQSLLNITIYALATRFLEGSVKLIIYNCAIIRGDTSTQLVTLEGELKKFNNPEYSNIKEAFYKYLGVDIVQGFTVGKFTQKDINFLNEIVYNRHKNVHATHDSSGWYSTNLKDILSDFPKEYPGLLNILKYIDTICYDPSTSSFIY